MLIVWGSFNVFFVQKILILVFCTIKVEETKNKIQKQKNKQTKKNKVRVKKLSNLIAFTKFVVVPDLTALSRISFLYSAYNLVGTGRKLNVHKTFSLRPVSTGNCIHKLDNIYFSELLPGYKVLTAGHSPYIKHSIVCLRYKN